MTVEEDLVRVLLVNAGVSALVGGPDGARIYALTLPQRVTLPAIRYQVISTSPEVAHTGPSGLQRNRVQLTVHAGSYVSAQAVAGALRRALDGKKGLFGPGTCCFVTNDLADYDVDSRQFMRHVDVEPWHREDV